MEELQDGNFYLKRLGVPNWCRSLCLSNDATIEEGRKQKKGVDLDSGETVRSTHIRPNSELNSFSLSSILALTLHIVYPIHRIHHLASSNSLYDHFSSRPSFSCLLRVCVEFDECDA